MVNMYSMGSIGAAGMTGTAGQNIPQYFKSKYGEEQDFLTRPYAQPYPMAVIQRRSEVPIQKTWLGRFFEKCFI